MVYDYFGVQASARPQLSLVNVWVHIPNENGLPACRKLKQETCPPTVGACTWMDIVLRRVIYEMSEMRQAKTQKFVVLFGIHRPEELPQTIQPDVFLLFCELLHFRRREAQGFQAIGCNQSSRGADAESAVALDCGLVSIHQSRGLQEKTHVITCTYLC